RRLRVGCFFFQAEDGIRGGHVTGVQTCALPILTISPPPPAVRATMASSLSLAMSWSTGTPLTVQYEVTGTMVSPWPPRTIGRTRSEERRVGKECRSGSAAYVQRKK